MSALNDYLEGKVQKSWILRDDAIDELAQLRADLQAAQERISTLENDIICAFCGTHYHADEVPPQHYLTCESSPLVQRIARIDADNRMLIGELETLGDRCAEQARQLTEARKIIEFSQQAILNQVSDGCPFCLELAGWETVGDITRMTTITHRTTCPIVITGKWLAANPAPAPEPQS